MALFDKSHSILMVMISFYSLYTLFAPVLDVSNAVQEKSTSGSAGVDGYWPFAPKHVIINNTVQSKQTLSVHCKSSEDDLGLIHIPWNQTWGFRFHVNVFKTTKFRCHFTWGIGESHEFNIFTVARDDDNFGDYEVCKVCIWEVGRDDKEKAMCRVNRDDLKHPVCFPWDDIL